MEPKNLSSVIQTVLIPLISVVTAAMVAWLNYSVDQVEKSLQQKIAQVDISIKQAKDERDKISSEREFNFKIYDLVQQSLEEKNGRKQEVAKQFILVMVDGELRRRLLGVLEAGGTPEIKEQMITVLKQEKTFESQEAEIFNQPRKNSQSFNWEDWDYDIFWCSESGAQAKTQAAAIVSQLQSENAKGRIRLRELPASVNAKTGYKISGYAIRRGDDEVVQADALKNLAENTLTRAGFPATFATQPTSQNTKWYISAFVCP